VEKCYENFSGVENVFLGQTKGRTKVLNLSIRSKPIRHLLNLPKARDVYRRTKQTKKWI